MRDTKLPLKATASTPDTSAAAFGTSTFDVAFQVANQPPRLSNAVLSTTEGMVAPLSASTSAQARGAAAFPATSTLTADAEVIPAAKRVIVGNLAANTLDSRTAAQALLQATHAKIAELRDARLNDPETANLIEFLEWLAQGLARLVDNLDCAIAQPTEPMFLGAAGEIAHQLKLGLVDCCSWLPLSEPPRQGFAVLRNDPS
jgi:hypothetical protein